MLHHHRRLRRRTLLGAAASAPIAYLAACSGDDDPVPTSSGDRVSLTGLTGFRQQPWESYLDLAIVKGYFADEGLEVSVEDGAGTTGNLQILEGGKAHFATLDVPAAIVQYSHALDPSYEPQDEDDTGHADFVLVSLLHRELMAGIVALESSNIERPRHLAGRSVAIIPGGAPAVLFESLAAEGDLDPETVEIVGGNPAQFNQLLAEGAVDATVTFVPELSAVERAVGEPLTIIAYNAWLTDSMGSGLGVTRSFAEQQPEVVRRLNRAAARGLQDLKDDPVGAGRLWWKRHDDTPDWSEELAVASCQATAGYISPEQGKQLGEFDEVRVTKLMALLQGLGTVAAGIDQDDLFRFDLAR